MFQLESSAKSVSGPMASITTLNPGPKSTFSHRTIREPVRKKDTGRMINGHFLSLSWLRRNFVSSPFLSFSLFFLSFSLFYSLFLSFLSFLCLSSLAILLSERTSGVSLVILFNCTAVTQVSAPNREKEGKLFLCRY